MVELIISKTKPVPADLRSVHKINRRVRLAERDLVRLRVVPMPKAGQNGAGSAQVQDPEPPTLESGFEQRRPRKIGRIPK